MKNLLLLIATSVTLTAVSSSAQSINVTSTGVGIGTSTPGSTLQLGALSPVPSITPPSLSFGGAYSPVPGQNLKIKLWDITGGNDLAFQYGFGISASQLDYEVPSGCSHVWFANGIEQMRLNGQGNVGIGTSTPNSKVEFYGANGQLTAALTDSGVRSAFLSLNIKTSEYGSGAAITFGNQQSNLAGSIGYAAIKGLLTNGGDRTIGDLAFSTRNATTDTALTERMRVTSVGNVGIGTLNPAYKLTVNGQVKSRGYITDTSAWSDYVFAPDYKLPSLNEVEAHIKSNGHLPDVPSEAELVSSGLDLGKMSATQMAQIEQLMLHVIALNKQVQAQAEEIKTQAGQVSYQAEEIRKLKSQAGRN